MPLLTNVEQSLPAAWYYEAEHHRRELDAIWYRSWICVGRSEQLQRSGDYFTAEIGVQKIIVLQRDDGIAAYFNTCRHRGSILCTEGQGRFRNGRIICPYHTWTYSLAGELIATPGRIDTPDFDPAQYSLYRVHTGTWGGFIFVNLAEAPSQTLAQFVADEAAHLRNWPLASLVSVRRELRTIHCNWKIFWENYFECYHCPRLHPELCKVMPVYRQYVFSPSDVPGWQPEDDSDDGEARVADGMTTWTLDGSTRLPLFEGLSDAERKAGLAFTTLVASLFVVGHPDYVRSMRIVPRSPELTELVIDWLLPPAAAKAGAEALDAIFELPTRVIDQDSRACELNQQGMRSLPHRHGVLVAQEYALHDFHRWVHERLAAAGPA